MVSNRSASFIVATTASASVVGIWYLWKHQNKKPHDSRNSNNDESSMSGSVQGEPEQTLLDERIPRQVLTSDQGDALDRKRILARGTITIAHASVTGTCFKLAKQLYESLENRIPSSVTLQLGKVEEWDWWDELLNKEEDDNDRLPPPLVILFLPTYEGGAWPVSALALQTALHDVRNDWRIEKQPLLPSGLQVAAFGMGSSAYDARTIGQPAREAFRHLRLLGAKPLTRTAGIGDDAVGDHVREAFDPWRHNVVGAVQGLTATVPKDECACGSTKEGGGCCQTGEKDDENIAEDNESYYESEEEDEKEPEVMDLEDMGDSMMASGEEKSSKEVREMVTPSQATALKKEGYRLIGTHSAVKLCRWTKHQLRGRGGCYKHTFYGITSYQCMEATPSLACANKCVFCWRHHKNPVGKEWRWKTDDPHFIVDEAVKTHVNMIKETKGIPGVQMDRWKEAHTVRHCALSLVGEPIMYPRIDELLGDLHSRHISTFLVTNGQHPAAIESLRPITQLYVSVDAPTPESLIAIDRPLFNDAWDRLKLSLSSLKAKGQRTVARLTVVKGWNSDEVEGYAKLIALGRVSLVEVKGVTYCGKSDASNLNMSNTPWHHEVVSLTQKLQQELSKIRATATDHAFPEYGLACEHKHSCSVLLARADQFAVDDPLTGKRVWKTWIDYDRFQELAARNAEDPSCTFSVEDYTAKTPKWALFGATEEGFDPTDTRYRKKKKHPKYTYFDKMGVPTHDHNYQAIGSEERNRLAMQMADRMKEIGCSGATVTETKGGAKEISDASLMFRDMVVAK